jgi:solute carrier family 25 phosphate transporter 23/24/25/41
VFVSGIPRRQFCCFLAQSVQVLSQALRTKMSAKRRTASELEDAFASFANDAGLLDVEGFQRCMHGLGIEQTDEELDALMHTADVDQSGKVDLTEFKELFNDANLKQVFEKLDDDHSGYLTEAELQHALVSMQIHVSRSDVRRMVKKVDLDSDGKITFEEFREIFGGIPNATLESVARAWVHNAGTDCGTDLAPAIPPKDLPLQQFLLAGGLGGVCSRTATAPLERVKLQAQMGGLTGNVYSSLRGILAKEGAAGLFAGNLTNCLRVFPFAGMSCVFYSRFVKYLPCDNELDPMEPVWRAMAGGLAGSCATILTYPLDVIRARQTIKTESTQALSISRVYRNIVQEHGHRGLFRGMQSTLFAVAPFVGLQQASYDVLKQVFIEGGYFKPTVTTFLGFGALAGLCAQSIVYPLDVVRRRIQMNKIPRGKAQAEAAPMGRGLQLYTWQALSSVVKQEGFRSLYAGIIPTMMKVAPAVAVSVVIRDFVLGRLDGE